jgi:hypothetical protein
MSYSMSNILKISFKDYNFTFTDNNSYNSRYDIDYNFENCPFSFNTESNIKKINNFYLNWKKIKDPNDPLSIRWNQLDKLEENIRIRDPTKVIENSIHYYHTELPHYYWEKWNEWKLYYLLNLHSTIENYNLDNNIINNSNFNSNSIALFQEDNGDIKSIIKNDIYLEQFKLNNFAEEKINPFIEDESMYKTIPSKMFSRSYHNYYISLLNRMSILNNYDYSIYFNKIINEIYDKSENYINDPTSYMWKFTKDTKKKIWQDQKVQLYDINLKNNRKYLNNHIDQLYYATILKNYNRISDRSYNINLYNLNDINYIKNIYDGIIDFNNDFDNFSSFDTFKTTFRDITSEILCSQNLNSSYNINPDYFINYYYEINNDGIINKLKDKRITWNGVFDYFIFRDKHIDIQYENEFSFFIKRKNNPLPFYFELDNNIDKFFWDNNLSSFIYINHHLDIYYFESNSYYKFNNFIENNDLENKITDLFLYKSSDYDLTVDYFKKTVPETFHEIFLNKKHNFNYSIKDSQYGINLYHSIDYEQSKLGLNNIIKDTNINEYYPDNIDIFPKFQINETDNNLKSHTNSSINNINLINNWNLFNSKWFESIYSLYNKANITSIAYSKRNKIIYYACNSPHIILQKNINNSKLEIFYGNDILFNPLSLLIKEINSKEYLVVSGMKYIAMIEIITKKLYIKKTVCSNEPDISRYHPNNLLSEITLKDEFEISKETDFYYYLHSNKIHPILKDNVNDVYYENNKTALNHFKNQIELDYINDKNNKNIDKLDFIRNENLQTAYKYDNKGTTRYNYFYNNYKIPQDILNNYIELNCNYDPKLKNTIFNPKYNINISNIFHKDISGFFNSNLDLMYLDNLVEYDDNQMMFTVDQAQLFDENSPRWSSFAGFILLEYSNLLSTIPFENCNLKYNENRINIENITNIQLLKIEEVTQLYKEKPKFVYPGLIHNPDCGTKYMNSFSWDLRHIKTISKVIDDYGSKIFYAATYDQIFKYNVDTFGICTILDTWGKQYYAAETQISSEDNLNFFRGYDYSDELKLFVDYYPKCNRNVFPLNYFKHIYPYITEKIPSKHSFGKMATKNTNSGSISFENEFPGNLMIHKLLKFINFKKDSFIFQNKLLSKDSRFGIITGIYLLDKNNIIISELSNNCLRYINFNENTFTIINDNIDKNKLINTNQNTKYNFKDTQTIFNNKFNFNYKPDIIQRPLFLIEKENNKSIFIMTTEPFMGNEEDSLKLYNFNFENNKFTNNKIYKKIIYLYNNKTIDLSKFFNQKFTTFIANNFKNNNLNDYEELSKFVNITNNNLNIIFNKNLNISYSFEITAITTNNIRSKPLIFEIIQLTKNQIEHFDKPIKQQINTKLFNEKISNYIENIIDDKKNYNYRDIIYDSSNINLNQYIYSYYKKLHYTKNIDKNYLQIYYSDYGFSDDPHDKLIPYGHYNEVRNDLIYYNNKRILLEKYTNRNSPRINNFSSYNDNEYSYFNNTSINGFNCVLPINKINTRNINPLSYEKYWNLPIKKGCGIIKNQENPDNLFYISEFIPYTSNISSLKKISSILNYFNKNNEKSGDSTFKYYNFKDYIIKYNYNICNKYYNEEFKLIPDKFKNHLIIKKADYKYWESIILKFPEPINRYKHDNNNYYFEISNINDKIITFKEIDFAYITFMNNFPIIYKDIIWAFKLTYGVNKYINIKTIPNISIIDNIENNIKYYINNCNLNYNYNFKEFNIEINDDINLNNIFTKNVDDSDTDYFNEKRYFISIPGKINNFIYDYGIQNIKNKYGGELLYNLKLHDIPYVNEYSVVTERKYWTQDLELLDFDKDYNFDYDYIPEKYQIPLHTSKSLYSILNKYDFDNKNEVSELKTISGDANLDKKIRKSINKKLYLRYLSEDKYSYRFKNMYFNKFIDQPKPNGIEIKSDKLKEYLSSNIHKYNYEETILSNYDLDKKIQDKIKFDESVVLNQNSLYDKPITKEQWFQIISENPELENLTMDHFIELDIYGYKYYFKPKFSYNYDFYEKNTM